MLDHLLDDLWIYDLFLGMDLRVHFETFEVYQSFLLSELGDVFD